MKNVVIAGYYNSSMDWQRGIKWEANYSPLLPLIDSIKDRSEEAEIIILHDCFDGLSDSERIKHYKMPAMNNRTGGWARWIRAHNYLVMNPDIQYAFIVDSTDVQMVNDPFLFMEKGKLYSGDEPKRVDDAWMKANHRHPDMVELYELHGHKALLNCGLCGGDRDTLIEFTGRMIEQLYIYEGEARTGIDCPTDSDMGIYNCLAYSLYEDRLVHGPMVNTLFAKWEPYEEARAWWKHK